MFVHLAMWLQRWLGGAYGTLYRSFGRGLFEINDAKPLLGLERPMINVAFSKLHSAGALVIFDRGKPRKYRLLDPSTLVLLMAGEFKGTEEQDRIPQERYTQLAFDALRVVRSRLGPVSFAVFGSVARGDAAPRSDLDLLLVSDRFEGTLASRIDRLGFAEEGAAEELAFLRDHGITPSLSFFPLRKEEVEARPIILLDPSVNAKVLSDPGNVLGDALRGVRARLELAGAKRVTTPTGWYWDLKPDFREGEVVVV